MKLTEDDKGRYVKIWLHPGKDRIAKTLGASKASVSGKIVRVGKDFVMIDVDSWAALPHVKHSDLKQIKFSKIKRIELFAK